MNDVFLFDVDGVVADLVTVWLSRYNKDYSDNVTYQDITDWYTDKFVKPECGKKIYSYLEDSSLYDDVLPISGSLEAIQIIREMKYRVVFCTNSTLGHAGKKYLWLKDHGYIDSKKDYIESEDKSLINAKYLIDDNFINARTFPKIGLLYSQPWNIKYSYDKRINNWYDILKYIDW